MRILLLATLLLIAYTGSPAQYLVPLDKESSVSFKIRNFGLTVDGSITGLSGIIKFFPDHPESSSFTVTVNAASVNTGIDSRDKHLRKEEYLDVNNFPAIKFNSVKVERESKAGIFIVTGKLTIKKVTKEIKVPFEAVYKDGGWKFEGAFSINRRDFAVGGNSMSMADTLTVMLHVTAK